MKGDRDVCEEENLAVAMESGSVDFCRRGVAMAREITRRDWVQIFAKAKQSWQEDYYSSDWGFLSVHKFAEQSNKVDFLLNIQLLHVAASMYHH